MKNKTRNDIQMGESLKYKMVGCHIGSSVSVKKENINKLGPDEYELIAGDGD